MNIIPVIHHIDENTTLNNAKLCSTYNAYGIFLISMDAINNDLPYLAKLIKEKYPNLKVGINLLGETAYNSVQKSIEFNLDMTWSDNPIISNNKLHSDVNSIFNYLKNYKNHLFFNSVGFKYQNIDNSLENSCFISNLNGFITTTSGEATGVAANLEKIKLMKNALKESPLAIASGLSCENISDYINYCDYGLISTGISKDYYNFDEYLLDKIIKLSK